LTTKTRVAPAGEVKGDAPVNPGPHEQQVFSTFVNLYGTRNRNSGFGIELGKELLIDWVRGDGYWNATATCQATGKRWYDYWRLAGTQEFPNEVSRSARIRVDLLVQSINGWSNELCGT
jgi:hypothetical protein